MAQSNLVIRLATGLIGAPLILALLFYGPVWGFFVFLGVACAVGAVELYGMTHPKDAISRVVGVVLTVAVYGVILRFTNEPRALLAMAVLLPMAAMMTTLVRLGEISTAGARMATLGFGPLYLGGGLACLAMLRRDGGDHGAQFVVLSLMLAWLSDTGAYFAGRAFGKHKLYEAVSPKKTVEGALGGLVTVVVAAVVASQTFLKVLSLTHAIGLAIVAGALGQAGDLGESLLKRSTGVKDSGGIIPGHGGILDRVDALLITGTLTYLYAMHLAPR